MNIEKLLTFQQIGDISTHGVFVYDAAASAFHYINEKFARIFQLTKATILNSPGRLKERILPEDLKYLESTFLRVGKDTHYLDVDFQLVTDPARHLRIEVYFFEAEKIFAGFVKDVTHLKEHEEYMINYGAKKNTLLEMLAHNLSGSLKLSQQVLSLPEAKRSSVTVPDQIAFVKTVTEQCIDTIHDLLREEHFLSERIYVKSGRFEVIDKIKQIIDQYQASHPGRHIEFKVPFDRLYVTSDDVRFLQILNNLLSNAVKFTPLNCEISVRLEQADSSFQVVVKDDGIGIPAHLQPLIFQRYTPAGRTGLNGEKSIGVGLSITKHLVDLLKGRIEFVSGENEGTTFFLTFPKVLR
jgi:two-component system, OmpR family, sensor histidine kinase VicK